MIRCTSQGFPSWGPGSTSPQLEKRVMYGRLCQHTRALLYLLYTQLEISFNNPNTAV